MLSDPSILGQFDRVDIVASQNEPVESLGPLPPGVSIVKRRFPARLRLTPFAAVFGYGLPAVDVAFGPFYYAFPSRAEARVVTVHDLSFFNSQFHPLAKSQKTTAEVTRIVNECDGVVCISEATLREFRAQWPHLAHKAVMIYNGVSADDIPSASTSPVRDRSILAVGTIEPRKNYPTLLDAFERWVREEGDRAPMLTILGNRGWMSESVEQRLMSLQAAGTCRWLRNASDEDLADAYSRAGVFTYLSLYEGFGYPPFEAALARCPMVLSSKSSVGEIWSGHARCVDPMKTEDIIAAWKWALSLDDRERAVVVKKQETRAREFTWSRTVQEYASFWKRVVRRDGTLFEGRRSHREPI